MLHRRERHNWEMPVEKSFPTYLVAFYFQTLLYGIYVVLFGMASYLLYKKRATTHWLFSFATILLFVLATVDIGLTHHYLFSDLLKEDSVLRLKHVFVKAFLYVTSNIVADCLLIHRCYTIWGRQKRIIFLPVVFLVALAVLGYAFPSVAGCPLREYARIYLWLTFAINISLSLLIAGRILLIALERRRLPGPKLVNAYHYAIAIVIESGAIYSIYVLLSGSVRSILFINGLIQVAGIVPTAIIVQFGLERHTASKTLDSTTTPSVQQQGETVLPPRQSVVIVDGRT